MGQNFIRFQSASGQQGVGDADGRRVPEGSSYVKLIVSFQIGTVNDVDDVLLIFFPVIPGQRFGDGLQLFREGAVFRAVLVFQHGLYCIHVLIFQRPDLRCQGVLPGSGIRYIEDIPDTRNVPGSVHQGDSFGSAPDIPAHGFVPQIIFRAGCRFRTLSKNHELLMERILIQAGSGLQKSRPLLKTACNLPCRILCHLHIG